MKRLIAIASTIATAVLFEPHAQAQMYFDITEEHVFVDLSYASPRIEIRAELEVEASGDFIYLLIPPVPLSRAELDGIELSAVPDAEYPALVVHLEGVGTSSVGATRTLTLELDGPMDCTSNLPGSGGMTTCMVGPRDTVFTDGFDSPWYFMNLTARDAFVGTVSVRASSDRTVVAGQGKATSAIDNGDATTTTTFGFDVPTDSLGLYAGVTAAITSTTTDKVVGYYGGSLSGQAEMERAVRVGGHAFDYYGRSYGEFGLDEVHLVSVPPVFPFAGLGLIGNAFFGSRVFESYTYLVEQGVAHELAHTWWGGFASSSTPESAGFMSESFAEYSAWRALGDLYGDETRTSGARMNAVWYMFRRPARQDPAVLDPEIAGSPAYVHVTYHKASTVLRTFEEAVGEAGFTEALRRFSSRGYAGLSTDAMVADIEAVTGIDTQPLVAMWLEAPSYPRITISTTAFGEHVAFDVVSEGAFDVALPMRVRFNDGTSRIESLPVHEGTSTASFDFDAVPVAIEVDPRWTAVREVTPAVREDVSFDGVVDGIDFIEVALRVGAALPTERRVDGRYDPLYDVNGDRRVDAADLEQLEAAAQM